MTDGTTMYHLHATSGDLKSQNKRFERGHRPGYDQFGCGDYLRPLRPVVPRFYVLFPIPYSVSRKTIDRNLVVSPV